MCYHHFEGHTKDRVVATLHFYDRVTNEEDNSCRVPPMLLEEKHTRLIPHIPRTRIKEIALRRHIQIRNHANLRVINIHNRKLRRRTPIDTQTRVISRPERFVGDIEVRIRIGVQVGDEGEEPVFHVRGDGGVVSFCFRWVVSRDALLSSGRERSKGVRDGLLLTGRVVGLESESFGGAVDLGASVEDQLVSRDACVAAGGSHVVGWAVDDEVAEERLALPESAVVGFGRVELVQAVEEVLLGVREQLLQVCGRALGSQDALIAEGEAFVAVAVDQ